MDEELRKLRNEIDCIDKEIIKLLEERVKAAKKTAEVKKRLGLPLEDPAREKEVLKNTINHAKKLDRRFIEGLYRQIIAYCKNEEYK